jgi:NAD(P)-dependent dehydrogenase (short-subunit alcohol dehydrogenase family)
MSEPRVVFITGATDGLGRAVAGRLAAEGDRVILHGRNPDRLAQVAAEIAAETSTEPPGTVVADLSVLSEVHTIADQLAEVTDHVDVLVNNAGVGGGRPDSTERTLTVDGNELRFAVNYLAAFDLTMRSLPLLAAGGGRIVNVASLGQAPLRFDDLTLAQGYDGWDAYGQSKLAMVTWGFTLAEKLDQQPGAGRITVNSLHPGTYMPTKMVLDNDIAEVDSLESGITATTRLISDPALATVTGRFYDRLREARSRWDMAYDPAVRARLWDLSLGLTGVTDPFAGRVGGGTR